MPSIAPINAQGDPILADPLNAGDKVEVRRRFDSQWARGFEVFELTDKGVRVRRLSDGEVLPVDFIDDDVRKERRRNDFWWM
ncbi:MAG TPA: hypothetical protein VGJ03_08700 [Acidimicrobiales bacterium]|jgi:hypothetical protein